MTVKVALIAAVAENGVMGKGDWLPWEIKSEFQYFKKTTLGHPIIFGRKTLETLGGPLPKRENIVVTRDQNYTAEGAVVKHTLEAAITHGKATAERDGMEQVFVGGGAEIYALALPHADRLYLTEIHLKPEGDTVFPPFDRSEWDEVKREFHKAKEGESADYTITVLERKG
ncbi:MAG: dihydrofolate reductase [bacterium]|nr:dihydrofolate reductase [bacterium]